VDIVIKIKEKVHEQIKINSCCSYFFESTAITSSARLAIVVRFVKDNGVHEEFNLSTLIETTRPDIYKSAGKSFSDSLVKISKIVSVATDGVSSTTGREAGFVTLFAKYVGLYTVYFHCTALQEAFCATYGLSHTEEDIMKTVTEVVNFIALRALNKRHFKLILKEVSGLFTYTIVHWLSHECVHFRLVECLNETKLFLEEKSKNIRSNLINSDFPFLCYSLIYMLT
jgi:hypothetical protein